MAPPKNKNMFTKVTSKNFKPPDATDFDKLVRAVMKNEETLGTVAVFPKKQTPGTSAYDEERYRHYRRVCEDAVDYFRTYME